MLPIHLAIGLVEGAVTAAVLVFVCESRPELIQEIRPEEKGENRFSLKTTVVIIAAAAAIVGGIFSLYASSSPDGLEWALFGNAEAGYSQNMALDEENFGVSSQAADTAASVQEKTAFLPDYAFKGSDSAAGTTVSGLVGSAMVAGAAVLICLAGGFFGRRKKRTA